MEGFGGNRETLLEASDRAAILLRREEAKSRLVETDKVFLLEGWLPADCCTALEKALEPFTCAVETREPAEDEYERLCSAAEMETRKMALAARQEVLGETYVRALDILCSMPREDYLALLIKLLCAAGGKGDEAIALSAKDRDAIGQALVERANRELNAHYTLAASAADIRAGLVLVSPECDVNCSFETLLALSRERTERGAAKILFAE